MRIGVMTAFSGMVEHYSLTSVVLDQIEMIRLGGHTPVLIALEDFNWAEAPADLEIRPYLPFFHKIDYTSVRDLTTDHQQVVADAERAMLRACPDLDCVFTHDLMFTGWNAPLALAVGLAAQQMTVPWFHWVHSVPSGRRDYWVLPPRSKLIYPNYCDRIRCAESFGTWNESVLVVPHCKDPRRFLLTTPLAKKIITEYDVLGADIIQTLPVAIDRIDHKGFDQIVGVFSGLKKLGKSVRLIVCNAWCNVDKHRQKVQQLKKICREQGLFDSEVIWTSLVDDCKHELGVTQEEVRDLMLVSNLFIYPTKSETFGLVVAEAAMTGQLLVLNASLPMMQEIAGHGNALYFHFGSHQQTANNSNWNAYYQDVAKIIVHRMEADESLRAKTWFRQKYRMEAIWGQLEGAILADRMKALEPVEAELVG